MATAQKLWNTAPDGTLWCETDGYKIVVQRSAEPHNFRCMVLSLPVGPGRSTILSSNVRRRAMEAMIAAEQAAAVMRRQGIWSRHADRSGAVRLVRS